MKFIVKKALDRRTLRDFFQLPFLIYHGDEKWVPPIVSEVRRVLDKRQNPYFRHAQLELLVCYEGLKAVARTAIIVNQLHWEKFRFKTAFFGFFESYNDVDAAKALFKEAERIASTLGADALEGPFNPNHYSELGLQINNFETPPAFFQSYNPPYYLNLLQSAGFVTCKTVCTARNDTPREFVLRHFGENIPVRNGHDLTVRTFRKNEFGPELERIREVFNDAFSENWNFLPLSAEEYVFSAKYLNLVTIPEIIVIVEHQGEPVGVLECVQNVNPLLRRLGGKVGPIRYLRYQLARRSIRHLIVYAVGIKKEYRRSRVYRLLLDEMCRLALQCDILEATWMSEDNFLAQAAARRVGLKRDKEFAILRMKVEG